jgi:hypothetical protein
MMQVYNERLIIVTDKTMKTYSEVKKEYPQVRTVIQNFALEHSVPSNIIETINGINSEYPLWVNFDVDRDLGMQKVLIYRVYYSYDLIDDISVSLDQVLSEEEKTLIANKINLINYCSKCKFSSESKALHCAVNPYLITDELNHCSHYQVI